MNTKITPPVAILGFGVEGRSAYDFLRKQKIYDVTICDENCDLMLPKNVKKRLGPQAFSDLSAFRTIIRSPGVHYELPAIKRARKNGDTVTSLMALTLETAADRITAITGSNGKTTTTALTAAILRAHYGERLIVGGNDGTPVLKEALAYPQSPILLEVSSFQFAGLKHSPHISAVLNITPNHLDWHENLDDYIKAKENLVRHQQAEDWAVLNANDENSARLCGSTPGSIFWVGKRRGKSYAVWRKGELVVHHEKTDHPLLRQSELSLKTHPDNLLFAAALGMLHGVPAAAIAAAIRTFKGVPHRLEYIRECRGVSFYNDSSCTTPESAMVAIRAFDPNRLILLLGGSSKNADFAFLAAEIVQKGARAYCFGREAVRIKEALQEAGGSHLILGDDRTGDFSHVVHHVYHKAAPGDCIVLSPACASFDMFKNAKERGYQFASLVNALI